MPGTNGKPILVKMNTSPGSLINISNNDVDYKGDNFLENLISLREIMSKILKILINFEQGAAIDHALLKVLEFFDVDRVYIGILDEKERMVDFTNEVTCDGILSMREDLLRRLHTEDVPWWIKKISNGEDIILNDIESMPVEACAEHELLKIQNVQSLISIPVFYEGKVRGFIGLDSVKLKRFWTAFDLENLRVFADILSIAIERTRAKGIAKYTEAEKLKSESKFQIIFDKLPWGVELYDENGNLLDLNQADLNIFQTSKNLVLGVNMFKNPNIPKWVNKKLKKGEDVEFRLDYNFNTVNESGYYNSDNFKGIKHLQVKGVPLKDIDNSIFGYLYMVFDDTENQMKREEMWQKELELAKVKEADVLKSAFLANMSHEIRTPLNAIVGFSDIIAETYDQEERQTYLDIIHKNNDLLLQLINDILDFSKIEAGTLDYHIEKLDIKEICGEIVIANSIKMKPGVNLIFSNNSPSISLMTDEKRIIQVISNFINNAIKFTNEGSITLYYEKIDDTIKVCVKDTGIGINETDQKHIFERFVKANTFKQGTGLGLTISKTIIEYLGGNIGVDSEVGKGSTFWFTLPLNSPKKTA